MKKWTIRILVLLFLLTGSACSQSVPPAEGEETLLVQGESGGPENLPPAFDPVVPAAEAVDPQWCWKITIPAQAGWGVRRSFAL